MSSSSICPDARSHRGRRRILAVAALAVWIAPSALALNPGRLMRQYIRDRWTEDKGFPGGAVYAFAQTPDGYLWIGAERGLVRFDGLKFEMFDHANTPVLSDVSRIGILQRLAKCLHGWFPLPVRESNGPTRLAGADERADYTAVR